MRTLTNEEYDLILMLLKGAPDNQELIRQLDRAKVEEMNDGGMGSLRFLNVGVENVFGSELAEITLLDDDKVAVSFSVNLDRNGNLFELDVFKADFSKLKKFPIPPYKEVI